MRVRTLDYLSASLGYLRAHPVVSVALGGSLLLANVAVCCGFGALAAPWFGCELLAFQLATATGARRARSRAWLGAGLFVLGAVLIVSSAAWITTLAMGADMPVVEGVPGTEGGDLLTVAVCAVGIVLSLVYLLPLIYSALVLIDRGGSFGGAVLESARLVHEDGFGGHLKLTTVSHAVQLSPVLAAAALAALAAGRTAVPLAVLASLPLLAVTLPLGQGMIVAAWAARRARLVDPEETVVEGRPPRLLTLCIGIVVVAPALSLSLLGVAFARPSDARSGVAPSGEVVVDVEVTRARDVVIPGTALELAVHREGVAIEASDGGGVGRVPVGGRGPIERVRVVRVRDAFVVEIARGGTTRVTWVDRAGVRLDDHLLARLADRVTVWGLGALGIALLLVPLVLGRAFAGLAEVRRRAAAGSSVDEMRERAIRRAWVGAASIAPLSVMAVIGALRAVM